MAPLESARPAQLGALASASAQPLVVAITARALFDLEDSHGLFERKGIDAYADYQRTREDDVLEPGIAFSLVRKLLALNRDMPNEPPHVEGKLVEVILLSRNSADTGLRIFNSIQHHGLDIRRATFTSGAPVWPYIRPFGAQLFLSANPESVRRALEAGVAAATILPARAPESVHGQLRIAFDGDAVIFSDESERVSREQGVEAFGRHERERAHEPLSGGPFRGFLDALHRLQAAFPAGDDAPIRTALVTARSAPAHERVIRTLREWDVRLDEALFLGGREKGPFLQAFGADIFFDDSLHNIDSARQYIAAGHVPHGVANP
ncbi:MAG TPA: 5'-nucleotidase [Xanthomonadaceae bacterium]|nr:5'-nucleotidase [Xanthomonadaceae bacterium]